MTLSQNVIRRLLQNTIASNTAALLWATGLLAPLTAQAQENNVEKKDTEKTISLPAVHGTVRSKYEYQTEEGEGRFEVRNARVSIDGNITPQISYKERLTCATRALSRCLMPTLAYAPHRHGPSPLARCVCPSPSTPTARPTSNILQTARSLPNKWAMCATWVPPCRIR